MIRINLHRLVRFSLFVDAIIPKKLIIFSLFVYLFLITHACAVWMPLSETCKQALESWQYRAAKIVIKTRMNIPKAALLLELGWEPILDFINRQKVSYYKRLLELPDNRLCKSVFNEMVRKGDSFWNYKEHVSSLITSLT